MDIPLSALFSRALANATNAANLPTIQDETQEIVQSAITDIRLVHSRILSLGIFSPNEPLSDISTTDLVYLFVPFVAGEIENRVRTTGRDERLERIGRIQYYLKGFLSSLENYGIVPVPDRGLYEKRTSAIKDPAKRRELKIKQYQKEKELRARIEALRKRRRQAPSSEPSTDFDLIASLLPSPAQPSSADSLDEDTDTDELLRETTLLLLRVTYSQAQAQLESIDQELDILRNAPPPPPPQSVPDPSKAKDKEQDEMWKLDVPLPKGGPDGKGPLMDPSGKPLRPFTILPAGSSERARLQAQVFQPDHRLPTMSVDEYLEIERERGMIVSGGGPQSEAKPTTSEQLAMDAEMDGTMFGEEKAEEKRQKDEAWARFTDENPRGAGNTMNRG